MSGANFNITTNRAANEDGSVPAGSGGGGGSGGGVIEHIEWNPDADSTTFATPDDITGVTNVSVNFPETGDYTFILNVLGHYVASSSAYIAFVLSIDDVSVQEFWPISMDGALALVREHCSITLKQNVSAGTHNVRIQWYRPGGTGTLHIGDEDNSEIQLVILK